MGALDTCKSSCSAAEFCFKTFAGRGGGREGAEETACDAFLNKQIIQSRPEKRLKIYLLFRSAKEGQLFEDLTEGTSSFSLTNLIFAITGRLSDAGVETKPDDF